MYTSHCQPTETVVAIVLGTNIFRLASNFSGFVDNKIICLQRAHFDSNGGQRLDVKCFITISVAMSSSLALISGLN